MRKKQIIYWLNFLTRRRRRRKFKFLIEIQKLITLLLYNIRIPFHFSSPLCVLQEQPFSS